MPKEKNNESQNINTFEEMTFEYDTLKMLFIFLHK